MGCVSQKYNITHLTMPKDGRLAASLMTDTSIISRIFENWKCPLCDSGIEPDTSWVKIERPF